MKKQLIAVTTGLLLSGCALLDTNRDLKRAQSESNPAGVKGLLRGNELRFLNTADLVRSFVPADAPLAAGAPKRPSPSLPPVKVSNAESKKDRYLADMAEEQHETDQAVAAFYAYYLTGTNDKAKVGALLRNEIQDRILAAANQRCHLWKNYYSTASSTVGFISGVTAATAGAAAVAFSPASTKNGLTALSTTATAVGTNYDKSYLFGLTLGVIYQGVDSRRANMLKSILAKRVFKDEVASLANYTLSAGIEDALEYHGACSVASGAQEAAERIADARTTKPEEKPVAPAAPSTANPSPGTSGQAGNGNKPDATTPAVADPVRTASPASIAPPPIKNETPTVQDGTGSAQPPATTSP